MERWISHQLLEHSSTADVVEGANTIDANDDFGGVRVRDVPEQVDGCIRAAVFT